MNPDHSQEPITALTARAFLWRIALTLLILAFLAGPNASLLYTLTQAR